MDPDPEGDKEGEGGVGGNEGIGNADDTSEKDVARSIVSFSLEKETKEPWPPPFLYLYIGGDVGSESISACRSN